MSRLMVSPSPGMFAAAISTPVSASTKAALKPQYEALNNKGGVMSNSNIWHRVCRETYFELVKLWKAEDYQGMADLVANTADPGPVGNGPARQEWEEARKEPADE